MKNIKKQIITLTISLTLIIFGFVFQKVFEQTSLNKIIAMIIFGVAFIIGGMHTLIEGIEHTIENKALNVDLLMILAAIGAFYIGDYGEGAILIFIFGVSHILEDYTTLKSEKSFTELLTLAPNKAIKVTKDGEEEVEVNSLLIGDKIIVKMGEQIPVDGIITEGYTDVDEKMITGEFSYKDKKVGDIVYAGTINMRSNIVVEVNKDAKETVVQKIIDFVEDAQNKKTKSETFLEKFEKWYVYIVILFALAVRFLGPTIALWDVKEALYKAIVVLVVASPCALVASVTPAILASLSRCSKEGVLVKGGQPFEYLKKIDVAVFDKTGTITVGIPQVEYYEFYHVDEKEFLTSLVSIENTSTHPLAKSIVNHFSNIIPLEVTAVEKPGIGVSAVINDSTYLVGRFDVDMCENCKSGINEARKKGYSVVQVAKDNYMVGFVAFKDTIRPQAEDTIKALNKRGIKTHLLTGDNYETALQISEQLNFTSFKSDCLPHEKVEEVKKLKENNQTVLMVGDGVNDAPALIESDVGIAMGSATDVSLEAADVVFVNNQLCHLEYLIKRSKKMNFIILQNIIFSIAIILVLLVTNLFTNVNITLGVLFHEGSTILVILNSLRLLLKKK